MKLSYLVLESILCFSVGALYSIKMPHGLINELSVREAEAPMERSGFFQLQFKSAGGLWRRGMGKMKTATGTAVANDPC